jgi:rod shape-determining protein MreC
VIALHDSRRTRVLLAVLLVVALAMITIDYSDSNAAPVRALRSAGGAVFGGAEQVSAAVFRPVVSLFGGSGGQPDKVAALQAEVTRLRAELSQARITRQQSDQLTRLLQVAGTGGYRVVAANVIAVSQPYQESVTLDAGQADGVQADQTVLNGSGLIGTVTAVTAHTCTVELASDTAAVTGVRVAPSGQLGYVSGTGRSNGGSGLLTLQMLSSAASLSAGQQLVTAASVGNRPFVPGVPVGLITQVLGRSGGLTERALVRPYADLSSLGVVGIVVAPPRRNPRFSVLPPSPAPTPVPTVTVTPPAGPPPAPQLGG